MPGLMPDSDGGDSSACAWKIWARPACCIKILALSSARRMRGKCVHGRRISYPFLIACSCVVSSMNARAGCLNAIRSVAKHANVLRGEVLAPYAFAAQKMATYGYNVKCVPILRPINCSSAILISKAELFMQSCA